MKTIDNDIKLKELLKDFKPESPDKNFTIRVMERIYAEDTVKVKAKNDQLFGWRFWIIVSLFVGITIIFSFVSKAGISEVGTFTEAFKGLFSVNTFADYHFLFSKVNTLPLSLAGIFFALSVLLFAERFIVKFFKQK